MPTPTASPASEITFTVTPVKYISTMANVTLIGIDSAVISVGLQSLRKNMSMSTARSAPSRMLFRTERMTMLEKERGISEEYLIEKIKAAIVIAVKKSYDVEENVSVMIEPATGKFAVPS